MLYAGQRSLRLRWSGPRRPLVCGVEYVLCKETQKVGHYASVFHFIHQVQSIHSFHRPTSPLPDILLKGQRDITAQ